MPIYRTVVTIYSLEPHEALERGPLDLFDMVAADEGEAAMVVVTSQLVEEPETDFPDEWASEALTLLRQEWWDESDDDDDDDLEEGDDMCDFCMRSGIQISMTTEDGLAICDDCAEDPDNFEESTRGNDTYPWEENND